MIPLRWYHPFSTLEVIFLTIVPWTLRYQHGFPKHLIQMGHLINRILWYQRKIKSTTKLNIFVSISFHPFIWFGNSSTSGATDTRVTEFCDETPPLHPWSNPMGWEETPLHQKDSQPTKNFHHADTETFLVIGSHLVHG